MKLFLFIILSLLMSEGCAGQTQLPQTMPEKISFSLHEGGGMTRYYKKIRIENSVLEFEELQGNGKDLKKWSAGISHEELGKLYRVLVENKFDNIKNDERKGIVHDAGSENISITYGEFKTFHVTYGKNSPLSGKNLERYQAVRKAIYDLVEKNQKTRNMTEDEAEKFIQGKWRLAGENNGHAWFLEWTFDNGNFKQLGYPPITQNGKYKVLSQTDNKLKLELYDQKGTFGEEKRTVEIWIEQESDQLKISGMNGFTRVNQTN